MKIQFILLMSFAPFVLYCQGFDSENMPDEYSTYFLDMSLLYDAQIDAQVPITLYDKRTSHDSSGSIIEIGKKAAYGEVLTAPLSHIKTRGSHYLSVESAVDACLDYEDYEMLVYYGSIDHWGSTDKVADITTPKTDTYANDFTFLDDSLILIIPNTQWDRWIIFDIVNNTQQQITPFITNAKTVDNYMDSLLIFTTSDSLFITDYKGTKVNAIASPTSNRYHYIQDYYCVFGTDTKVHKYNIATNTFSTFELPINEDYYVTADYTYILTNNSAIILDTFNQALVIDDVKNKMQLTPSKIHTPYFNAETGMNIFHVIYQGKRSFVNTSGSKEISQTFIQELPALIAQGLEANAGRLANLKTTYLGPDPTTGFGHVYQWEVDVTAGFDNEDNVTDGILYSNPIETLYDCIDIHVDRPFTMPSRGMTKSLNGQISLQYTKNVDFCLYIHSINQRPNQAEALGMVCSTLTNTSNIDYDLSNKIRLFPNPTSDYLTLSSDDFDIHQVTISDLSGITLSKYQDTTRPYNIAHLAPGIYWVNIFTETSVIKKRFTKVN